MIEPRNEFVLLADRFLAMLRNERGASQHTVRAYAREVRSFADFLAEKLGKDGQWMPLNTCISVHTWHFCTIAG
jgi:integrase/recombinase XerC